MEPLWQHMVHVVGFTPFSAINAYHHYSCEFYSLVWQGVLLTPIGMGGDPLPFKNKSRFWLNYDYESEDFETLPQDHVM